MRIGQITEGSITCTLQMHENIIQAKIKNNTLNTTIFIKPEKNVKNVFDSTEARSEN